MSYQQGPGNYQQGPGNYQQGPGGPYNQKPPGQGMSVASMVLGIVSLVIPYGGLATAIVGLVLGVMGKKKNAEVGAPAGMATAGIVCSIIGLAGSVLLVVLCSVCASAAGVCSYL